MSTFDDNFPAKGNPKMSDRVFGFDSEGQKNAGITNQALYDLFKDNLEGEFPTAESLLPAFDLDNIRVMTSTAPDNKIIKSNVLDPLTGQYRTFKELDFTPPAYDGRLFIQAGGKDWGDADFLVNRTFNVVKMGGDNTGVSFSDNALNLIKLLMRDGDKIVFPHGTYKFKNIHTFTKSVEIDFGFSDIICEGRDGFIFTGTEKYTTTVTTDYTETGSRDSIVLSDASNANVGDIINIISTELFDGSRSYNYKGGNFIIIKKSGNTVFFNGAMPFDMSASSIEVKIYKAPKVKIYNINKIYNSNPTTSTLYGIRLVHCKNSEISGVETDNFKFNIDIYRCVNIDLNRINTGHAKSTGDNWDGYGVAIQSSTNVTLNSVVTNSGQHGVTNGGREVSYNLVLNSCVLKSELMDHGWGSHVNIYTVTFNDCSFFGFAITGNVTFNDCVFNQFEGGNSNIGVRENPRFAHYLFNNCQLSGEIRVRHTPQILLADRKNIGSIIFRNCKDVFLYTQVNLLTEIGQVADIDLIRFDDCKNMRLILTDNVKSVILNNVTKQSTFRLIQTVSVDGRVPFVRDINIAAVELNESNFGMSIENANLVKLQNIRYKENLSSQPQQVGEFTNVNQLIIEDSDLSQSERHLAPTNVNYIRILNTKLNFLPGSFFDNFIQSIPHLHTDNLQNFQDGLSYNIRTGQGGDKYKEYISNTGRKYIGSNAVAYLSDLPSGITSWDRPGRNYTLDTAYINIYIRFSYAGGLSTSTTIPPSTHTANTEIFGEVEGDGRTFVAGAGVTLRYPEGQGLTAPTGSRFIIKFKSPNDALVTIIKPQIAASSANTATVASGATPTKVEFDALLTELRDLKTKMRTAGLLAT